MSKHDIWVAVSKQTGPDDFYVKVDGSDFYTAYWVVLSTSKDRAKNLVIEVSEELVLGETEMLELHRYDDNQKNLDEKIMQRVRDLVEKLPDQEDAQMAAWVSGKGGLW